MKILLVDNETNVLDLLQGFEIVNRTKNEVFSDEPQIVGEKIRGYSEEDYDAILINAEGQFGDGSSRQHFKGIEVVFWLRLKHKKVLKPIILYGFHSAEQILSKHPENLILLAPGNRYVRLPFSLNQLDVDSLYGLTLNRLMSEYVPFVKPAFNMNEFRHEDANWWGIKALWDTYFLLHGGDDDEVRYPKFVEAQLTKFNNLLSNFLYGNRVERADFLLSYHLGRLQSRSGEIEAELDTLRSADGDAETLEFKKNQKVQEYFAERERLKDFKSLVDTEDINVDPKKSPPIILIDDQASDGWAQVYQRIFYKADDQRFSVISFDFTKDSSIDSRIKTLVKRASDKINALFSDNECNEIPVVLLDIRLFPEFDNSNESVSEMSGVRVLQELRKRFQSIPIIITSASNKLWTLDAILDYGADAYWMKEGIDNFWSGKESVLNYQKLVKIISRTQSLEYHILHGLFNLIRHIQFNETPNAWWTAGFWRNGDERDGDTKAVLVFLNLTMLQLRRHCRDFVMKFGHKPDEIVTGEIISLSGICNNLGSTIESVFGLTNDNYNVVKPRCLSRVRAEPYHTINKIRNQASHHEAIKIIKVKSLEILFYAIESFLRIKPDFVQTDDEQERIATVDEVFDDYLQLDCGRIEFHHERWRGLPTPEKGLLLLVRPVWEMTNNLQWYDLADEFRNLVAKQNQYPNLIRASLHEQAGKGEWFILIGDTIGLVKKAKKPKSPMVVIDQNRVSKIGGNKFKLFGIISLRPVK